MSATGPGLDEEEGSDDSFGPGVGPGDPDELEEDEPAEPPAREAISVLDPLQFAAPDANIVAERVHTLDDIMIVSHPSSGSVAAKFFAFEDYCSFKFDDGEPENGTGSDSMLLPESVRSKQPWRPFRTRSDFEVAEVMLSAHMNQKQIEATIQLFNRVKGEGPGITGSDFTLVNAADLLLIWDQARQAHGSAFQKCSLKIPYKNRELEYTVWLLPLWDWCTELLLDTSLIYKFHWDAERIYKYNDEGKFERIIDEPWTADSWWNFQNTISGSAKPLCIIIYADKTRLSSFGTEKGYPVLARCANLPISIRNGNGVGGARLVGWLPIPEELASETKKPGFINHKREIWHEAVSQIFKSIEAFTEFGTSLECADGVTRIIYPHILILSADYEEQVDMALVRGVKANYPCPICLVHKGELSNLSQTFELRTAAEMQVIWSAAQQMNATQRDEYLRGYGLRDVENTFWKLKYTDVHAALSWDRLHAYHSGIYRFHILQQLRDYVLESLDNKREAEVDIDFALAEMPRWPGLNHFKSLASMGQFADGTKFEDHAKLIIFASQHVLTPERSPSGFSLLKIIRSYLELDMFASLTLQSESTLEMGRQELLRFDACLTEYKQHNPEKDWNAPKLHTHQHIFRDIMSKGVTRNYNTKPNEKMNGPLKTYYQRHTNFKNVASQILKVGMNDVIATIIRNNIGIFDELEDSSSEDEAEAETLQRVTHGSRMPTVSIEHLENENARDAAFQNFRRKVNKFLANRFNREQVIIGRDHEITPFRFLKARYASEANWALCADILRANPNFHNRPRYDFALIKVGENEAIFAQLIAIFDLDYASQRIPMALILPFDQPRGPESRIRHTTLRLTRLRPRARKDALLIDTNTIIRGGLIVPDRGSRYGESFVVDFTDEDIWLRMKSTKLVIRADI
ncbi:hypothetical protein GALMADRAFT_81379 [Galerina marginata CBS 339.88]|uniref:Uncharacterized protein n=1 Tax=Galerina marginata (strain CBS 339.88) TaxID=685588 RepID=A0A067SGK9_GALM3|nr:hypothetical protein GALMADRAFT_81379 [Galerina marginata CBS 339.88]